MGLLVETQTLGVAKDSEICEKHGRENRFYLRDYLNHRKNTLGSERTKEMRNTSLQTGEKVILYMLAEHLVKLHRKKMWDHLSNELSV